MLATILELVVAPGLVGLATLASRRWSERVGGHVSAFPVIVGPVLLITAHEHGAAFAARAANGTLLGVVALSGFAVGYGRTARHSGSLVSLAVGWAFAAMLAVLAHAVPLPSAGALALAAVSLAAAHHALGAQSAGRVATAVPPWDIPFRMALTALLVGSLAAAAGRVGPLVAGMLASLPVLACVLAVFTHRQQGGQAVLGLLRGMLSGMVAFVAFCEIVALLLVPVGVLAAFTTATLVAVGAEALAASGGLREPAAA